MPRTPARSSRKHKRPAPRGLRRSVSFTRELLHEVVAQARQEERKVSDMIRILIQRGLRTTRGGPPSETP